MPVTSVKADVPMPPRVARLPRNKHGRPIPWFVATLPDGTRDFRIGDQERLHAAHRCGLCWVCGQPRGANLASVIGPMCAVNRITAEPPGHLDCATYSVQVCPFLRVPGMVRRESGKPDGLVDPAGIAIARNPGVALIWVTKAYELVRLPEGVLFQLGEPVSLSWWREGRAATRAEVLASMEAGLPALQDACRLDADPAASLRALEGEVERALALVPDGPEGVTGRVDQPQPVE